MIVAFVHHAKQNPNKNTIPNIDLRQLYNTCKFLFDRLNNKNAENPTSIQDDPDLIQII